MLIQVDFRELTDIDLRWLIMACQNANTDIEPAEFVEESKRGEAQLWRWNSGILVTQIITAGKRRELLCAVMAGKNFLVRRYEARAVLFNYARQQGCGSIVMDTSLASLQEVYQRMGAEEISRRYRIEVPDYGQSQNGSQEQ